MASLSSCGLGSANQFASPTITYLDHPRQGPYLPRALITADVNIPRRRNVKDSCIHKGYFELPWFCLTDPGRK
jgi:hypothetical protein